MSGYSQALQSFIQGEDDVVGLIAYALYKQNIQQRSISNLPVPPAGQRTLVPGELSIYRDSARRILESITTKAIEEASPDILLNGVMGEVKNRTRFSVAVLSGVAAWFLSIIITIVIAIAAPEWAKHIARSILQS